MITYIIQVVLFQAIFLAVYDLFLSKETFFKKNRWYLLGTAMVSFLIPFIKIPTFQKAVPEAYTIYLPEIVLSPQTVIEQTSVYKSVSESTDYLSILFFAGIIFFFLFFLIKLSRLLYFISIYKRERKIGYTVVQVPNSKKAFSFFNYIFLGKGIEKAHIENIISHELIHSKQRHTYDLLFFELLKIGMWFNPLLYVYQKRIATVHEYISDAEVAKLTTKEAYVNKLMNDFFDVENISFVNQFYKHSLLKKRIKMISKENSKQMKQVKYLLIVPVLMTMLFYIACSDNVQIEGLSKAKKQKVTLYSSDIKLNRIAENQQWIKNEGVKETYLDIYLGKSAPDMGVEISESDLLEEERLELEEFKRKFNKDGVWSSVKLYKLDNGRKMIAIIMDFNWIKKNLAQMNKENAQQLSGEEVPFSVIETSPTFPGCEDGDKNCFSKKIRSHFAQHFNTDLPKTLGLSNADENVRISILFHIDKQGDVNNFKARAPHKALEEEAKRILELLPKMKPGKQRGKKVTVQFSLAMKINIPKK
jgi:hypothetical protein